MVYMMYLLLFVDSIVGEIYKENNLKKKQFFTAISCESTEILWQRGRHLVPAPLLHFRLLCPCGIEHILDENTIPFGWLVDQDVGHSAHQLPVLEDGRSAHECVNIGTTLFYVFLKKVLMIVEF